MEDLCGRVVLMKLVTARASALAKVSAVGGGRPLTFCANAWALASRGFLRTGGLCRARNPIPTILRMSFLLIIAGVVNAIEKADRWHEFAIPCVHGQAPTKGVPYRNAVVAMVCTMLFGVPDPSWANLKQVKVGLDNILPKTMRAKSGQYLARLEEMRAEVHELLSRSGDQYLNEIFRGGAVGVR